MTIAVVGAGSWGSALAVHLGRVGHAVRLWVREAELLELMAQRRDNPWFLPGIGLPPAVRPTATLDEALERAELVVIAVPSEFFGGVVKSAAPAFPPRAPIVSATKGLDPLRHLRMTELLAEASPRAVVAALSGPTFAREVALGRPAAAVVACADDAIGGELQRRGRDDRVRALGTRGRRDERGGALQRADGAERVAVLVQRARQHHLQRIALRLRLRQRLFNGGCVGGLQVALGL